LPSPKPDAPQRKLTIHYLPWGLAGLALLGGALLLISSLLPYISLKSTLDAATPDGSLESFTAAVYRILIPLTRRSGLALIGLGGLTLLLRRKVRAWAAYLFEHVSAYSPAQDLRHILQALTPSDADRPYLLALTGVALLAAIIRVLSLFGPMLHDEAYTYIAFASRPLRYVISDYHLPNNHIFHTLLVFLSTRTLGNHPWSVRLPAYLAGVLTVPAVYLSGRMAYDRAIGLLAASLAAISGALIHFSSDARGYSLITLFTLLSLALADYVRRRRSPLGWAALILVSSLGFYTHPTMLYPFGIVMTWLFLSALAGDVNPRYGRVFYGLLALTGISVILLTGLLYSPVVLIGTGWESLVGNRFIAPFTWEEFWESLPGRADSAWELWTRGFPPYAITLAILGFAGALALQRRISSHKIPLQLAVVLWVAAALAAQRVAPLARVWLFLLPLLLVWCAAGWVGFFQQLPYKLPLARGAWLLAFLALALPAWTAYTAWTQFTPPEESRGLEEQIVLTLQNRLKPGDTVAARSPLRAVMEYYFSAYGISRDYFYQGGKPQRRAWVVVSEKHNQTLEEVLARDGLGKHLDMNSQQVVASFDRTEILLFKTR
jgi:uncharacterized membrane protein